jgi:mono/diheme cytochrome c family protein
MPGLFQNTSITDENLADISTYIRNEWTNKAPPVSPELFKKLRAETKDRSGRPYTAAELK